MLVLVITSGFGLNQHLVITLEAWTILVFIFQYVPTYASPVSVTRNNAYINCMLLHTPAIQPIEIRYFADFHLLSVNLLSGSRLGHKYYMSPVMSHTH